MKRISRQIVATKMAAILLVSSVAPARAGLPVIDASNLSQNIVTAIENVAHTAKQIEQYQTQLRQYENMLRNTTAPSQQIWDSALITMNQLRSSIDTLNYYKANLGGIDAYLGKSQDTASYRAHPCFSVSGCTQAQWNAMKDQERFGSEAQKRASDALLRGLDSQQNAMVNDAAQLQRLQSAAAGAGGQVEAIGYANQLASNQANQLLQIRALLIAQQNALITRERALADREAKEAAASERIRTSNFRLSKDVVW